MEAGEEADSPDREDVTHTSCHSRHTMTRRKLDMSSDDVVCMNEGAEVVAFARRGTKKRGVAGSSDDKNMAKKRQQELESKSSKRKKSDIETIEIGNEDEVLVIDGDVPPQKKKHNKETRRGKKQTLLHADRPKTVKTNNRKVSSNPDTEGKEDCIDEVGNADGHLMPSPPSYPSGQRRVVEKGAEAPLHGICRWLTKSLSHPLSEEASHTSMRPALQHAIDFIQENVRMTIEQSFNNSILLVGSSGTGKTMAVSRVCNLVDREWNTVKGDPKVGIVRLSGLAFSDEKSAFKEIAKQLCTNLQLEFVKNASFGQNIKFLLSVLKALADANKAALFILEDFDLFAQTQKQTFLYCLLDSLQKSQSKAIVIGTTCRHDCLELLEKRVRSRFSHRTITLVPPIKAVDENNGALDILKSMLTVPSEVYPDGDAAEDHNKKVEIACSDKQVTGLISDLVESSNSVHMLAHIAKKSLLACSIQGQFSAKHLVDAIRSQSMRGFESNISTLCPLDLAVLAAAHKVRCTRDDGVLNFEMIHHEFRSYFATGNHVDNYSKVAAMKSFEHLISQGLLQYTRRTSGPLRHRDRNFTHVSLQVTRQELLQGFDAHANADMRLRDWCQKDGGPSTTALALFD